ncbi:MAG TPA: TIGR01459 family HAD-type hydrolase [Azospirillaceae bacterium]|nr:TIGR01459 family HAD-type hydrolase [Azospirillaceae bacterium]
MTTPILSGIASVADRYDGFILDLWGVLYDGEQPYPGAIDCLDRLRAAGKTLCLLSNAPRRNPSVERRLSGVGVTPDHYDHLLTSGEATHWALLSPPDAWHAKLGRRCLHIGPPRDKDIFPGLGLEMVATPEAADFVVNTGIDTFDETLDDYEAVLQRCIAANLPMVCANPDLVVMVGDKMAICAGMLAKRYKELGGAVAYHGKPYAPVYRRCFELLGISDKSRILAVGDSLRTDVAGANAAGIDVALVTGGIHLTEVGRDELGAAWGDHPDPDKLDAVIQASGHTPTYAVPHFAW